MKRDEVLKLAITICTRRRPVQLARAIAAISNLHIPSDVQVSVIVVENDDSQNVRHIAFGSRPDIIFSYFLEPDQGISPARNRAIEEALRIGADWIVTTDDDGEMDPYCLVAYAEAIAKFPKAAAFVGRTRHVFPDTMPEWLPRPDARPIRTGDRPRVFSTANCIFNRHAVSADGHNLRFDRSFGMSGGEDLEFLSRVGHSCGAVVWVEEAIVVEHIIAERTGVKVRFRRHLRNAQNTARIMIKQERPLVAFLHIVHKVYQMAVKGIFKTIIGGLQLPFHETAGLTRLFSGLFDLTFAIGMIRAYVAAPTEWYRQTDGY